jgi:hypothetical protein
MCLRLCVWLVAGYAYFYCYARMFESPVSYYRQYATDMELSEKCLKAATIYIFGMTALQVMLYFRVREERRIPAGDGKSQVGDGSNPEPDSEDVDACASNEPPSLALPTAVVQPVRVLDYYSPPAKSDNLPAVMAITAFACAFVQQVGLLALSDGAIGFERRYDLKVWLGSVVAYWATVVILARVRSRRTCWIDIGLLAAAPIPIFGVMFFAMDAVNSAVSSYRGIFGYFLWR